MEIKKFLMWHYLESVRVRPVRIGGGYKYFRKEKNELPINKKLLKEINIQQDHYKYNEIRKNIISLYRKIRRRKREQSICDNEN